MAYTIIGQNNSVTTIDDGNGHTLHVPSRVALAIGTTFTIVEVNNNMATLEDSNGKVYRDIPCVVDLVGSGGGGSSLPDQTGHSGEFLTTDGTDASWSDKPLVNTATGANTISILGNTGNAQQAVCIGINSDATYDGAVAIGFNADVTGGNAIAIGKEAKGEGPYGIAIGSTTKARGNLDISIGMGAGSSSSTTSNNCMCIGYYAQALAHGAYQFGYGTNSEAGTVCFSLNTTGTTNSNDWHNYKVLNSDGTIPSDRLVHAINKYSTMPTAASTNLGWIVQFTGTTDSTYTHGHLYECVSDGADPATYSWTEVQLGGGGSSYTAGTGIDITGGVISIDSSVLSYQNTGNVSMTILGTPQTAGSLNIGQGSQATGYNTVVVGKGSTGGNLSTVIGDMSRGTGHNSHAIGYGAQATGDHSISIGSGTASAAQAIQIGRGGTNADANTFKVSNANGNFEIMNATGNLPADRLASTTGLADGNYRLRLTMASGVPTLSWVAE